MCPIIEPDAKYVLPRTRNRRLQLHVLDRNGGADRQASIGAIQAILKRRQQSDAVIDEPQYVAWPCQTSGRAEALNIHNQIIDENPEASATGTRRVCDKTHESLSDSFS